MDRCRYLGEDIDSVVDVPGRHRRVALPGELANDAWIGAAHIDADRVTIDGIHAGDLGRYCTLMPGGGGLACVSMPHLTSSAVISAPSWNFTPWRSLKTYVWSSGADHPVASAGWTARPRSQASKESYMNSLPQWFWVGTAP